MGKDHARYSPSQLDKRHECLRFKYKQFKEDEENTEAAEGTMLHAAFEKEDMTGLTEDQTKSVQEALDYANSLLVGPGTWVIHKERKVTLKGLTYGSADWSATNIEQRVLHILDEKYIRVEGVYERQLRAYGAAAFEEFCEEHKDFTDLSEYIVHTHVVAPRIQLFDVRSYNGLELISIARKEIEDLYERIDDPFNPPTPQADLCANCGRAAKCTALNQTALATARGIGLPLPASFDLESNRTPDERGIVQAISQALVNWGTEMKKQNSIAAKAGAEVTGYTMRSRSTGLSVHKDDTEIAAAMLIAEGFTMPEILAASKMSINGLAKIHKEVTGDKEADIKLQIKDTLSAITHEGTATFLTKTKMLSDADLVKQIQES